MAGRKNLYTNDMWVCFASRVMKRDGWKCLKCHRSQPRVVLQVHHEIYLPNRAPWEYALSDCSTLCKGCHAREHALIEPSSGWILVSIDDLGGPFGICERTGCCAEIRYEHTTYHPGWGYKRVGSTCIEHLTKADKNLSGSLLVYYRTISNFVHSSRWRPGTTRQGIPFFSTRHNYHSIFIYGDVYLYSFQLHLKARGRAYWKKKDAVPLPGKSLEEVKELAYIALRGATAQDESEKTMLRRMYKSIK